MLFSFPGSVSLRRAAANRRRERRCVSREVLGEGSWRGEETRALTFGEKKLLFFFLLLFSDKLWRFLEVLER